jgi:hypothetical protein
MKFRFGRRSKTREPTVITEREARWVVRIFTVFSAIFVLVGIFFTVQGVLEWDRAATSASWPTVQGTVTRSEVTSHRSTHKGRTSTSYHAHIEFDYEVDGRGLHGTRRSYKVLASSQSAANEAVAAYPIGRVVTVSYDPGDHEQAVLEPGWDWSNAIPIAIGLFAVAFTGFIRWLVVRSVGKAVQRMKDLQSIGVDPTGIEAHAEGTMSVKTDSVVQPTALASSTGKTESTAPGKPSGPAQLNPTFHDDLPGTG